MNGDNAYGPNSPEAWDRYCEEERRMEELEEVPKISTGEPSTLGTYLKLVKAFRFGPKAEEWIRGMIKESPKGENEVVIAHETQMLYMFGTMMKSEVDQHPDGKCPTWTQENGCICKGEY